jgi:flagellar capping protein FliD
MSNDREKRLESRLNSALKRIEQLEKLNKDQFNRLHDTEVRNMHLEEENAYLRSMQ